MTVREQLFNHQITLEEGIRTVTSRIDVLLRELSNIPERIQLTGGRIVWHSLNRENIQYLKEMKKEIRQITDSQGLHSWLTNHSEFDTSY